MRKYFLVGAFIILFSLTLGVVFNFNGSNYSNLQLAENKRYSYYVNCLDYCGDRIYDATELNSSLYFEVREITNSKITVLTSYNASTPVDRPFNPKYDNFSFLDTYELHNRVSDADLYSWQFITLKELEFASINVSVPIVFLTHAPDAFESNIFTLNKLETTENLLIFDSFSVTVQGFKGEWETTFTKYWSNVTTTVEMISYYDVVTGVLVKMELDMTSQQDYEGDFELLVDETGSFYITLLPN